MNMLKEIRVKNLISIKAEVFFTMEPDISNVSEHENHIIENSHGDKLLKVASIYGPNAGGKTTLLKAFNLINEVTKLRPSFNVDLLSNQQKQGTIQEFKFCDKANKRIYLSSFYLEDLDERSYEFEIELKEQDNRQEFHVIYEQLSYLKLENQEFSTLFIRERNTIEGKELIEELGLLKLSIADTQMLLTHLYVNYVNKTQKNKHYSDIVYRLANQILNTIYYNQIIDVLQNPLVEKSFLPYIFRLLKFDKDEKFKKQVISFLSDLGIDISDIYIDQFNNQVYFIHQVGNKKIKLHWDAESEGSKGVLMILLWVFTVLRSGGIMLFDEIDAHLHPKVVKKLIELFNSEYNTKTQFIFNSHDIWNMNNDNFRRDEIWFIYRTKDLNSELVCLSDYINYKGEKVRKDAKYSKQYMEGKYGADPFIAKGIRWYASDK